MEYLIDPQGRWWRWPSMLLSAELGYEDPDFDLAGYAARNLGYLWIAVSQDVTLLQFRASALTPKTVSEAATFLHACGGRPVALVYFASGWMEEASTDPVVLAARLEILGAMQEPMHRPLYLRRSGDPDVWQREDRTALSSLFALWRANGGLLDERVQAFIAGSEIAPRTVFVQPVGNKLRVMDSGTGFTIYDDMNRPAAAGCGIAEQPDVGYGTWVEGIYRGVVERGEPAIDDIDAIIEAPGHDPRRRRYRRLALPWRDRKGRRIVTGSSILDPVELSIPLDLAQCMG